MKQNGLTNLAFGLLWWILCQGHFSSQIGEISTVQNTKAGKIKLKTIQADQYGLHNVLLITDKIFSGSEPHGEEAFKKLAELGIKTIVSVDGARPQLQLAEKYGLRYVHIPIGYDGVNKQAGHSLARLVQEAKGPIYIHCHHGQHRGPAAAAVACIADGATNSKEALKILIKSGTSKNYPGLWKDVESYTPPSPKTKLPNLVEVARVSSLAAMMAKIDRHYDHLKFCEKAQWQTPKKLPDLVPSQEALILHQTFAESAKAPPRNYDQSFRTWMTESAELSSRLRSAILSGQKEKATRFITSLKQTCNKCHTKYRN